MKELAVEEALVVEEVVAELHGLTASEKAYCWGESERGQVGDASCIDGLAPSAVAGDLAFEALDAGFRHTCARATTGTVHRWGSNGGGQLGTSSTSSRHVPTMVSGPP